MHERAAYLIDHLSLVPHPEGGYFREVYRSPSVVQPDDDRDARPGLTTIYFLLVAGQTSAWHRVRSDEVWHYYEGDPLALYDRAPGADAATCHRLGPPGDGQAPVAVIPADHWQAAEPLGAYTLVGCTVGPGFVFEDFEMAAR